MDDLVERLQDAGYVLVSPGFRKLAHEAAARIEYLGKRLEVVPGWSESADGISCRDDTIKLQDARIQALEASLAEAEGRVIADVVAWLRDRMRQAPKDEFSQAACDVIFVLVAALETGEWKK